MTLKQIIFFFHFVFILNLVSLIAAGNEEFILLFNIAKYFFFVLLIFSYIRSIRLFAGAGRLDPINRLLILLFLYATIQSIFLGAPVFGSFKILLGVLFVLSIVHFELILTDKLLYKGVRLVFTILMIIYLFFFLEKPFTTNFREVRADIGFLNGNEIAGIFSTFYPLVLYGIQRRFSNNRRTLFWSTGLFILAYFYLLVFYNGSRFAIISSSVTTLIILYNIYLKGRGLFRIRNISVLLLVPVFLVTFNILRSSSEDDFFSRDFSQIASGAHQEGNLAGRIGGIWIPLIRYTNDNSFWFGFGNESVREISTSVTFWVNENNNRIYYNRDVHNFFITVFVEWGFIGLVLFITIFVMLYVKLIRAMRREKDPAKKYRHAIMLCSLIGFTSWMLFANAWYSGGWFILFLFVFYVVKISQKKHESPAHK